SRHVNDALHWRERAGHMRALSLMMGDVEAQAIMQQLANDYDKLTDRAPTRVGTGNIPKPSNKNAEGRELPCGPGFSAITRKTSPSCRVLRLRSGAPIPTPRFSSRRRACAPAAFGFPRWPKASLRQLPSCS